MSHMNKWGFLRETSNAAQEAGIDKDTGLHRTGLEEYREIAGIYYSFSLWFLRVNPLNSGSPFPLY